MHGCADSTINFINGRYMVVVHTSLQIFMVIVRLCLSLASYPGYKASSSSALTQSVDGTVRAIQGEITKKETDLLADPDQPPAHSLWPPNTYLT